VWAGGAAPKAGPSVDGQARAAPRRGALNGYLDHAQSLDADLHQRRSAPMAQDRAIATGKHGSHPAALASELSPANRVHAGIDPMETAGPQAMRNRVPAVAEREQLGARHHPVLRRRQRPSPRTPFALPLESESRPSMLFAAPGR
jgi:hypothetical protein